MIKYLQTMHALSYYNVYQVCLFHYSHCRLDARKIIVDWMQEKSIWKHCEVSMHFEQQ